jgi:predicted nucleotide-binding protein
MAARKPPPPPQPAVLTPDRMRLGIKRLEAALRQVQEFEPNIKERGETVKAESLSVAVEASLTQTFGHGTIEYGRYKDAAWFHWPVNYAYEVPLLRIQQSLAQCKSLAIALLQEAISFLQNELELLPAAASVDAPSASRIAGTNVVIGHGGSAVWRELRDFLRDRLKLPVDEFNAVATAGLPTVERLKSMLESASFAFLVMTAEDEQPDGTKRARENVVHEIGLFQGRLGFEKAIILLEEGCEEFSNIQGLGQIRFKKGNLSAKFEDVRSVLEREGLLKPGK